MAIAAENKKIVSFSGVLSAAKKLSVEERQLLRIKLFAADGIKDMKAFEAKLKKSRPIEKKKDKEIVDIVKQIRSANGKI